MEKITFDLGLLWGFFHIDTENVSKPFEVIKISQFYWTNVVDEGINKTVLFLHWFVFSWSSS